MVDATKGIGSVSGLSGASEIKKINKRDDEKDQKVKRINDKADIPHETLNSQQAEKTAVQTGGILKNSTLTLGLGDSFDETV